MTDSSSSGGTVTTSPFSTLPPLSSVVVVTPIRPVQSEWVAIGKDLFAGTLGACAGIVVGQPLDTVKLRMQTGSLSKGVPGGGGGTESALGVFRKTVSGEGPRALFKGLLSPLLANAPINAIVFGARGHMGRLIDGAIPRTEQDLESGRPSYWRSAIAAAWAGAAQLLVCVPMELVKCRLQVQISSLASAASPAAAAASSSAVASAASSASPGAGSTPLYSGTFDCLRQVYRSGGVRGLYAGWWVTFWRDVPAYAAWFLAYDYTRTVLQSDAALRSRAPVDPLVTVTAGSVAGIATWLSTYPFDVIKSIIQTSPPGTPKEQLKILYVARVNYAQYGPSVFFRGLTPTLLRAVPVSAVTFLVYEWVMEYM